MGYGRESFALHGLLRCPIRLYSDYLMLQLCLVLAVLSACRVTALELPTLDHLQSSTPPDVQKRAVEDLIRRIVPERAEEFSVVINPGIGPAFRDTFQLRQEPKGIEIQSNSGIGAAWGFHYYLTQFCECHIAWEGAQLNLPRVLPAIPGGKLLITSNDRFRYYSNVCTVSYSHVWWNWRRWERHIDWLALNGFNLVLAFTGQEAIWQRVYLGMGFTQQDLDVHIAGPAFLAWSRMGNIRGWGGPLPPDWYKNQLELQKKIVERLRSFGMITVLPGFAGHVPQSIKRVFPNASVTRLGDWGHMNASYCCTYLLDPEDPIFTQIGRSFIKEMMVEFGTDHVYNADTFNEMIPQSNSTSYLKKVGRGVYNAMISADPQAIWLMQGWLFFHAAEFWRPPQIRALLTSVPAGKMIVLDLMAEYSPIYQTSESFYGQPFIWCMLHNFGGTLGMHGSLEAVNEGPFLARKNTTIIGIGITMEGIFQNYVVYDFMMENSWRKQPRDIAEWMGNYARRRYGVADEQMETVWRILGATVYNDTLKQFRHGYYVLTRRPSLSLKPLVWYDIDALFKAWSLAVQNGPAFADSSLFRYDLVDLTRQSLQVIAIMKYAEIVAAYGDKDELALRYAGGNMSQLLEDMDLILGSDVHFLLGAWLAEASSLGMNRKDKSLYIYNAKNQITLWGPEGNILDYATKQWAGIVDRYYRPRWELFVYELLAAVQSKTKFNNKAFRARVLENVEKPFTFDSHVYPAYATGDSVKIAKMLHKEYRGLIHNKVFKKFYSKFEQFSEDKKKFARNAGKWLSKQRKKHKHFLPLEFNYVT